jgi:hypothetical protein
MTGQDAHLGMLSVVISDNPGWPDMGQPIQANAT